jgi:hypothetical protein
MSYAFCMFLGRPACYLTNFLKDTGRIRSRDSSDCTATGYGLDGRRSIPGRASDFCLLRSVQTCSGVHPASYPMGSRDSFPGDKEAGA